MRIHVLERQQQLEEWRPLHREGAVIAPCP